MKFQIILSEETKRDLEDIWHTTAHRWSIDQANKYYELLEEGINQLSKTPELGRVLHEVSEEYRIYKVKSHLIIYSLEGRRLEILRILHERMEKKRHIGE